jgi:hypothetical protein
MKFAFTPFVIRRGTHLNCRGWPVSICLLAAAVQKRRSKGRYIEERRRFHPSASECSSLFVFFLVVVRKSFCLREWLYGEHISLERCYLLRMIQEKKCKNNILQYLKG